MLKIADFTKCNHCKYKALSETEEPCEECLDNFAVEDSRTPINFEPET